MPFYSPTLYSNFILPYVVSGCVWSGDSYGASLNGSMTAGTVFTNGGFWSIAAVTAHAFTASKDTYVDVNSAGAIVYTEVSNNAASPALVAGSIRIAIIVTGAGSIAAVGSVNQGQENKVLPIASSIAYAVTDSLGNLICPRDPNNRVLGYRQSTSSFTTTGTSQTQVTGLSVPVIIPTGRKIKVSVGATNFGDVAASTNVAVAQIWDGTVGSGSSIAQINSFSATSVNGNQGPLYFDTELTPSATTKTYNIGLNINISGTASLSPTGADPTFIRVELY